jgi:hypothetical protein
MEVRGPSIRLASVAIFGPMQRGRQPEPLSVLKRFFSDFRKIFGNFATQISENKVSEMVERDPQ